MVWPHERRIFFFSFAAQVDLLHHSCEFSRCKKPESVLCDGICTHTHGFVYVAKENITGPAYHKGAGPAHQPPAPPAWVLRGPLFLSGHQSAGWQRWLLSQSGRVKGREGLPAGSVHALAVASVSGQALIYGASRE